MNTLKETEPATPDSSHSFLMKDHRDDVAPTLPNELLSSIFLESASADSGDAVFSRPERTTAPLNLSWVNSQWRQVALSTPQLWTSIALPNEPVRSTNPNPNPTPGDVELLTLYVSRSGKELPLSFALGYGGVQSEIRLPGRACASQEPELEAHVDSMHRLTLIMDRVRHRWRVLVMHCGTPEALNILPSSLVIGAPLLEHLLISSTTHLTTGTSPESESESGSSHVERMLDLARCPQLKNIVLQCPQLRVNPFLPDDAPLMHLTSLAINATPSQPDAFTWLQSSPNLETLSIQFVDAPPFALPHARLLTLERLKKFSLACLCGPDQEASDPSSFLYSLRLPALRTFELFMDDSLGADQGWPHVTELLRRSGPRPRLGLPLDELELLGTPMTDSELLDMLDLVPGLKRLAVDDALTSDEVLRRLSGPTSESESVNMDHDGVPRLPLCSELETLALHACSASLQVLASLVSSRCCRTPQSQDQDHCDESNEDLLSNQIRTSQLDDRERYRTLSTLELVHSYRSLPPVSEHPMLLRCQEDGLKIVQRPRATSRASRYRID